MITPFSGSLGVGCKLLLELIPSVGLLEPGIFPLRIAFYQAEVNGVPVNGLTRYLQKWRSCRREGFA